MCITYEVVSLNKAVRIDTQAIQQEKLKSYIYLSATPSKEQENLGTGTVCHLPHLGFVTRHRHVLSDNNSYQYIHDIPHREC